MAIQMAVLVLALHLGAPLRPSTPQRCGSAARCCAAAPYGRAEPEEPLTSDGGVRKQVLAPAPEGAASPERGSLVSVRYTGGYANGTVLDGKHADEPLDFQLGGGTMADGLERGVGSMRVGERARVSCSQRWAAGVEGLERLFHEGESLVYDVELVASRPGPPLDDDDDEFDLHTYKASLEGRAAAEGRTAHYRWREDGEEVTLWFPLADEERAADVSVSFRPREIIVSVGEIERVRGELRGKVTVDDCYWVIDDEGGGRLLQVVLAKAGAFTAWDGALLQEELIRGRAES